MGIHRVNFRIPADPRVASFRSGPVVPVPRTQIHEAFEYWADRTPGAVAAEHLGESITYAELDRRAEELAVLLIANGVRPGDNVGLFVRRSISMLIGLLAALKAGAAYVPQDVKLVPGPQLRQVAETARTAVVLTTSEYRSQLPGLPGSYVIAIDEVRAAPRSHRGRTPRVRVAGENCYVLFTSGTTGRPNGVVVTHENVANLLLTEPGGLGIRPGWRVGQLLNIGFDMAAWEILGCLTHGGTLVIRGSDIAAAAESAHVIIATPSVLARIDPDRCRRVQVVAVAGEPCPRPLADDWAGRCAFWNGCGPTETTIVNTMQLHRPDAERLTIGKPTPNNSVYVLDERGRECGVGETGEMWAGGAGISAGYLDNPALNAERYAPDPFAPGQLMFRTRDLGRWTDDGELEHLGRTDDQVKIRGFRVELDCVSAALESAPGTARAVTLKHGTALIAFVTPATADAEAARAKVAESLPHWCVPDHVWAVGELPQTSRGKIDKATLLATADQLLAAETRIAS
jgi:D-alanine--poly(phosphoribitol) ligase subunit 1